MLLLLLEFQSVNTQMSLDVVPVILYQIIMKSQRGAQTFAYPCMFY